MPKSEAGERPAYSKWFADVASTDGLSGSALHVALRVGAIGLGVNECGRRLYFEGTAKISALTGLDRRTVQRALAELVEKGLLRVAQKGGGRGRATKFQLCRNFAEDRALARTRQEKGGSQTAESAETGGEKGGAQTAESLEKGGSETAESAERAVAGAERAASDSGKGRSPDRPNLYESKKNGAAPPLEAANAAPLGKPDPNPPARAELDERRVMLRAQARQLRAIEGGG